jgi:broad specificity phosphatase PhoE
MSSCVRDLIEAGFGAWEGLTRAEAAARDPAARPLAHRYRATRAGHAAVELVNDVSHMSDFA